MLVEQAAIVKLIDYYLNGLLDPFITPLELHKLMYFLQEAGEPLHLQYVQSVYGPYAKNLYKMISKNKEDFVVGYFDGESSFNNQLELVPSALEKANIVLRDKENTLARLTKVSVLIEGFESPFGLELLSTVQWVATRIPVSSVDDVIVQIYAWNERKRQFSKRQIGLALNVLNEKKWLNKVY